MAMKEVLDQIVVRNTTRARKNINSWRTALQTAERIDQPKRVTLYNLYDELILDTHLSAEMQKRILATKGCDFSLYDPESGDSDTEKSLLFKKPWFSRFLQLSLESLFWGHSLIQLGELGENGEIEQVSIVPRKHVIPEFGYFIKEESDVRGITYRGERQYEPRLVEIGTNKDLGLFNKTAPLILYKRFTTAAWSDYTEIFGMPLRVGKTETKNRQARNDMESMMIKMGSGGYAVIDKEDEVQFVENAKSNGDIYQSLISFCNGEVSKLINGAIIGEDSVNGSRSKEEVGERTAAMIVRADKQMIEGYINAQLIPKLIDMGYAIQGLQFRFENKQDMDKLWATTQGLLPHFDVPEEYISQTFGIPVTKKENVGAQNLSGDSDFFA